MWGINILDSSFRKVAVLQNAKDIQPKTTLNGVGRLVFEIPYDDPKREHITPFAFVELVNGGAREDLYRVLLDDKDVSDNGGMLKIQCEHVLATLLDDPMPGFHAFGGPDIYTRAAINFVLDFQIVKHWQLGDCEYNDQYEYGWQHEKCLPALNSILACMENPRLDYDVSAYPWTIHIRKINLQVEPTLRIAWKYNMMGIQKRKDSNKLANRLYAYGYGEGVNQLSIRDVNGGLDYIDEPVSIAKYGIKAGYYVAREIEDAATLLAAARKVLTQTAEPQITYTITGADVYQSTGSEIDRPAVGKVAKVYDEQDGEFITFVTEVVGDAEIGEVQVSLSNVPDDVANTIAEIADRQRIEQTYAQGATQLWGGVLQNNASETEAIVYPLWIPAETVIVNKVMLKVSLSRFRAYSKTTTAGGGTAGSTTTSKSGGGRRVSSESGGASTSTSGQTGGGSSTTSASSGPGLHQHTSYLPYHHHPVYVPSHTHDVSVPSHTHDVDVPGVPSHSHNIDYGIYYATGTPTGATVTISGNVFEIGSNYEGDITAYLLNEDGAIPRGRFIDISIKPNALAFVNVAVSTQGFVQSRGGGNY